ncbi:hypothetical protein B0J14DRAFT_217388 [Halenospora varia]|nr:hypothetical protein B0J14DRAFT_217388 [Halenospora varia]
MAAEDSRKRLRSPSDLETNYNLEQQPKLQKISQIDDTQIQGVLAEFGASISNSGTLDSLVSILRRHPETVMTLQNLNTSVAECNSSLPPIDFSPCAHTFASMFDPTSPSNPYRTNSSLHDQQRQEAITRLINRQILSKINKHVCFSTKLSALKTLISMVEFLNDNFERSIADKFITGDIPDVLSATLVDLEKMLNSEDLNKIAREEELVKRWKNITSTELQAGFWGPGPIVEISDGLRNLLRGDESNSSFEDCVIEVRSQLAGGASNGKDALIKYQKTVHSSSFHSIKRIITDEIAARVNRGSGFETKLYALKALVKIAHLILDDIEGHQSGNRIIYDDHVLENLLTDELIRILTFENGHSRSSASPLHRQTFTSDEELMRNLIELDHKRNASFPELGVVLQNLGICGS